MLPSIALLSSVEMIRDGGSLSAIFQGANGSEYWLLFKVRLRELPTGEVERLGYEEPIVIERLTGITTEMSWQHASILLGQIRPLLREEAHRKWFEAMYESTQANGQLPSGVERVCGQAISTDGQSAGAA